MMTPSEKSDLTPVNSTSLPTAIVSKKRGLLQSKFWILTALALLLALGLAWWTTPEQGIEISIHFPDGHGLHDGDPIRYRGINVGVVQDIHLASGDGVDVEVMMDQSAKGLLQNGANFWIVRPQLALTGISGLETAVGPKYIAVEPDSLSLETMPREFKGLADVPQGAGERRGTEIVFQADEQFGVNPGSSLSYRGFEVGKILDVHLSDDARHVNFQAVIHHPHERLVTSKSKFWANSGIDVDFSLRGGLSLDTDSLETIARGGISFLTVGDGGTKIAPGQVFKLHKQPEDQWLEQANQVRLPTVDLKGAVTLVIKTSRLGLLGRRSVTRLASAIPVRNSNGETGLLIPSDVLAEFAAEDSSVESVSIDDFSNADFNQQLEERLRQLAATFEAGQTAAKIVMLPLDANVKLPWQNLTTAENVSGVIAVRRPVGAKGDVYVHQPISAEQLTETSDGPLAVEGFVGDHDLWNGCPILSADAGEVIGALVADGRQVMIIPANQLFNE